jgi:uncharacterized damage-inducible protein DinB
MTAPTADAERTALTFFLNAQRASVLAIVDGLGDHDMTRSVAPSGWTPASLIEHLGDAEHAWFTLVVAGEDGEDSVDRVAGAARTVAEALAYYRAAAARSDEILAVSCLDARPAARPSVDIGIPYDVMTVRDVVLHMIEETARHAGHLDIARESVDGRTGLGPR